MQDVRLRLLSGKQRLGTTLTLCHRTRPGWKGAEQVAQSLGVAAELEGGWWGVWHIDAPSP